VESEILEAARRCFYREGITATGVDRLAEEAGVSKRTIYKHFGSKEGVVTAYLRRREAEWRSRLEATLSNEAPLIERVLDYLDVYMLYEEGGDPRGCAFINASAEFADPEHPGLAIVQASLDHVIDDITEMLTAAGMERPGDLAEEIALVFVGTLATTGMRRDHHARAIAERTITHLISTLPVSRA
jgi:AcrR family transcriptional regulator